MPRRRDLVDALRARLGPSRARCEGVTRLVSGAVVLSRLSGCIVLALGCALLLACQGPRNEPELLVVADVAPQQIELGDRLEIVGDGFPEGRSARVELEGDLYRVGDPLVRSYQHTFEAKNHGRNIVVLTPSEAELRQVVGSGADAAHTTFRGSVRLVFASRQPNSGPVYGTLSDLVLDVFPWSVPEPARLERSREAERFQKFLGVVVSAKDFEITLVKPGSVAERAGLKGGDRLLSLDGVRLRTPSDFFVGGAAPRATLSVRRGKLADPIAISVPVEGFRPVSPHRLGPAALLIMFVAALVLVFSARSLRLLVFIERRFVQRYLQSREPSKSKPVSRRHHFHEALLARELLPKGLWGGLLRPVPYFVFLGASAAFAAMSAGYALTGPDTDLASMFLVSMAATVSASLLLGGWQTNETWTLGGGLRAAASAFVFQLPAVLAIACAFVHATTLRPEVVVSQQGMWPWQFHAFKSPMMLFSCIVLLATCLPESSRRGLRALSVDGDARLGELQHRLSRSLCFFAELTQVFVVSGLAAILFLGGWSHGLDEAGERSTGLTLLVSVLLLQAKTLTLVFLVLGVRWLMNHAGRSDLFGFWIRWLLPLSVGALVASVAYERGLARSPVLGQLQTGINMLVFLLVCAIGVYFVVRIVRAVRAGSTKTTAFTLNPWL